MPKLSRKPPSDSDQHALSVVEESTAEEREIQDLVDSASEVPTKQKPPTDPIETAHSKEKNPAAELTAEAQGQTKKR